MRFSCRNTCSASGPITGWCSNTVCRPTTARSVDANAAATFRLCGTACCTQAGHSIWNACRNTTRPRRDCSDGAPSALNQRDTVHSGAIGGDASAIDGSVARSEEHTSELQSLMRISYAVFCLKKKKNIHKLYSTKHIDKNILDNRRIYK